LHVKYNKVAVNNSVVIQYVIVLAFTSASAKLTTDMFRGVSNKKTHIQRRMS